MTKTELMKIWKEAKDEATNPIKLLESVDKEIVAEYSAKNKSLTGFIVIKRQMDKQKIEGLPYEDTKTFNLWKKSGYTVKKGEKSSLFGIVWKTVKEKDSEEIKFMYPKQYSVFHRGQVTSLENKKTIKNIDKLLDIL